MPAIMVSSEKYAATKFCLLSFKKAVLQGASPNKSQTKYNL